MDVSVSAGSLADAQCLFNSGNGGLVVLNKCFHALWFRFHLQQCLLEIQVHWKLMRQLERAATVWGGDFSLLSQNVKELSMKLQGALGISVRDGAGIVIKEDDLTLKE